jgi:hypothetical protein
MIPEVSVLLGELNISSKYCRLMQANFLSQDRESQASEMN